MLMQESDPCCSCMLKQTDNKITCKIVSGGSQILSAQNQVVSTLSQEETDH